MLELCVDDLPEKLESCRFVPEESREDDKKQGDLSLLGISESHQNRHKPDCGQRRPPDVSPGSQYEGWNG